MQDDVPQASSAPSSAYKEIDLRNRFIELEFNYLTESSFHCDRLRNQVIQFYLVIAGAAATAVLGLADLQSANGAAAASPGNLSANLAFIIIPLLIGLLGLVLLPIFVRLRRVVLECLQGTVLLKAFVVQQVDPDQSTTFEQALLWDAHSLPTGEGYLTASFLLVFVVMLLNSFMFMLGTGFWLAGRTSLPAAILWALVVGFFLLTVQVIGYRSALCREIIKAMRSDRLSEKWERLGIKKRVKKPGLVEYLGWPPVVGVALTAGLAWLACWQAPLNAILPF